jgi:hypothetical protein
MRYHISLLVFAAFLAASCDGTDAPPNLTEPTPFSGASKVSVSTTSPFALAQPVSNPLCPSFAPFNVPLVIVVQPDDVGAVAVTAIRIQFVDTSGMSMPQVTLPAPVPTTQIGTDLANARSAQTFPVTLGIGCGTGHVGNVQIFVETHDMQGRTGSGRASVTVR